MYALDANRLNFPSNTFMWYVYYCAIDDIGIILFVTSTLIPIVPQIGILIPESRSHEKQIICHRIEWNNI